MEHQRVSGFLLGLIVVLSLFLVCLEFTTSSQSTDVADDILDDVSQDIEMMPVLQQKNMIAAPQAAPKRAMPEKMKVVDEQVADVVEKQDGTDTKTMRRQALPQAASLPTTRLRHCRLWLLTKTTILSISR